MRVVKVIPESYKAYFGFDYKALSKAAEAHEGRMEFKEAFNRMFNGKFKNLVDLTLPYISHAETAPAFDESGHADAEQTRAFLETVMNASRAAGVPTFQLDEDIFYGCFRTPYGWIVYSGYPIFLDGQPWRLDEAVDDYIATNGIPPSENALMDELRNLQVMMWTLHDRVSFFEGGDPESGAEPIAGEATG